MQLRVEMANATQEERERAAFAQARALRKHRRKEGVDHAFETVFSHPSTLMDMRHLREAGFEVVFYFVTTTTRR